MKRFEGKTIGVAMTGSFCTINDVLPHLQTLVDQGANLLTILSNHASQLDTRFNQADEVKAKLKAISGRDAIQSIVAAEPIGPKKLTDVMLVAPCTGNTLAKIANAITDTPALMAVKSHLRNQRPVVIALASNDALAVNAKNLGLLLNAKHIYFVPFGQDAPEGKSNSMQAKFSAIADTVDAALQGRQLQPLLLGEKECLQA